MMTDAEKTELRRRLRNVRDCLKWAMTELAEVTERFDPLQSESSPPRVPGECRREPAQEHD